MSALDHLIVSAVQVPYVVGCDVCDNSGQEDPNVYGWHYYGALEPGSVPPCAACDGDTYGDLARFIPASSGTVYPVGERMPVIQRGDCERCDNGRNQNHCYHCRESKRGVGFVVFGDPVPVHRMSIPPLRVEEWLWLDTAAPQHRLEDMSGRDISTPHLDHWGWDDADRAHPIVERGVS